MTRLARAHLARAPLALVALAVVTVGPGLVAPARAHQPSEGVIVIAAPDVRDAGLALEVRWDLAVQDLQRVLALDADGDGQVLGRELEAAAPRLVAFARDGLTLSTSGPCTLDAALAGVSQRLDGLYASLALSGACPPAPDGAIGVTQRALFADDPGHRALVRLGAASAVLRADAPSARVPFVAAPGAFATLTTYVGEGILHILEGLDHVLFLMALLLPAVLRRRRDPPPAAWIATERLTPVALDVLKIVTAFTLAHSITLVLATLGVVAMPSAVVETAIALSVAAAALNNLRPLIDARWTVAFGLGLLHGFGFSSVLLELGLPDDARALALFGFNVGVELGQVAIVLVVVPLIFVVRRTAMYRYGVLAAGSAAIALLALYWSAERAGLVGS